VVLSTVPGTRSTKHLRTVVVREAPLPGTSGCQGRRKVMVILSQKTHLSVTTSKARKVVYEWYAKSVFKGISFAMKYFDF